MRTACGLTCLASKAVVPQWAALFGDLIVRHLADDIGCRSELVKADAWYWREVVVLKCADLTSKTLNMLI
jgi:hypothetical protein